MTTVIITTIALVLKTGCYALTELVPGLLSMENAQNAERNLMMYELKIISDFAAAHRLMEFKGECENLHGHNWKVEVFITGENLGNDGLLCDFKLIKNETEMILSELDHKYLNELEPFRNQNPSSENIACHIFKLLSRKLNNEDFRSSLRSIYFNI